MAAAHLMDNDANDVLPCAQSNDVILCDPVISYIWFSMNGGTRNNIKRAVLGHFTPNTIYSVRNALWDTCDTAVIGKVIHRNESASRSAVEITVDDILDALSKLDTARMVPNIMMKAVDLYLIPKSHPEELSTISLVDRLNVFETKMSEIFGHIDRLTSENIALSQSSMGSDVPTKDKCK